MITDDRLSAGAVHRAGVSKSYGTRTVVGIDTGGGGEGRGGRARAPEPD
jgi:hypothetical protein